ncbi:MAG: DUF6498-containing protein, partial [Chloroflexota bacterium]|nr:DUF6498-containing protein [Chloroflexota bacterium]
MVTSEVIVWARTLRGSTLLAAAVLVAVNLVPLIGVLFWGWDVAIILISYWLENGIIGLINVPKIVLAAEGNSALATVTAGFFAVHYGGFWLGHGIFVFIIVGLATRGPLGFFFSAPAENVDRGLQILFMALLLFLSHGISFLFNYVGRKEY